MVIPNNYRTAIKKYIHDCRLAGRILIAQFSSGVLKFSKVSLFSNLNNLNDTTMDASYSAICGYTEMDVDTVFAPELNGLNREDLRRWYNGYNWTGEAVYNPFDFATPGLAIILEDAMNQGWIDMTVKFKQRIYLFEFKVVELTPEGRALQQIKDKGYAEKYRPLGQPIHLIGVEFSRASRNVVGFEIDEA